MMDLTVQLPGLNLKNPLMPASGCFGNALTGLKQFREENLFYVHNTICSRYHTFQLFDVCAHSSREVLI